MARRIATRHALLSIGMVAEDQEGHALDRIPNSASKSPKPRLVPWVFGAAMLLTFAVAVVWTVMQP